MNFFPLWTASVCPTISGKTVERRDQVFTTFLSNFLLSSSIFLRRCSSTKGPLLTERAMCAFPYFRRRTMNASVRGLLRVFLPLVGTPQGVHDGPPPEVLPSPPPCGWSTGVIATPRTVDLQPFQRLRPALPMLSFSCSMLPTWPIVAQHSSSTLRVSPEGSLTSAQPPSRAMSCAPTPAESTICPPFPRLSSTLWIVVPSGMTFRGRELPTTMSASGAARIFPPTTRPLGARM